MTHFDHNARHLFARVVFFPLSGWLGDIDRGGGGLGGGGYRAQ